MASPECLQTLRLLRSGLGSAIQPRAQKRTICVACSLACRTIVSPSNTAFVARDRLKGHASSKYELAASRGTLPSRRSAHTSAHRGPIAEYDARVESGRLRDDQHQRTLIQALQDLHDTLSHYKAPKVVHPTIESLQPKKKTLFGSFFGSETRKLEMIPYPELPKGLYMYGDVGSGKTMLMDLFYDTLPPNITSKNRIHFHNFMQEVHKALHKMKSKYGNDIDAIPFVAAQFSEQAAVLCFDEFQCTDVADAMILRRLIESLMAHGTVLVTTSNRHPTELYKNGIQRESFIPCINLLLDQLRVLNLDSTTDYRKIPRPPSGVYHHPLDAAAKQHVQNWFRFLGDFEHDPPHVATHEVWGRQVSVPRASGRACCFTFQELMGKATGAADYIELTRSYDSFIITDVPGMNLRSRDLARRFITFVDAAYEARARLVLTTAVPLTQLFMSKDEIGDMLTSSTGKSKKAEKVAEKAEGHGVDDAMRSLMDDLGMNMDMMKQSSMFTGDEEAFAFARALSRLSEMGSQEWVERGLGMGEKGTEQDVLNWQKVRSNYHQDSYG